MQNIFNKLKSVIVTKGDTNFSKANLSLSNRIKLKAKSTMLLLEENDTESIITMSFYEMYKDKYFAFRIERKETQFKILGECFNSQKEEIDVLIDDTNVVIKLIESEIENLL